MASLHCGLNLLFNVVKKHSIMLHLSIFVDDSRNCRPCLHSHFFIISICSTCGMLFDLKILFTSSLKFLSSLHLSSPSQLNVGCFITGPPILGPTFCILSALATAMARIAALVASATACIICICLFTCHYMYMYSFCLYLPN